MADWGKRVIVGSLVGALIGALVGLVLGRILWMPDQVAPVPSPFPTATIVEVAPTQTAAPTGVNEGDLESESVSGAEDERIAKEVVLLSALYALDGDIERARQRLAILGLDDPADVLAALALDHVAEGNDQVATDLATLAAALGHQEDTLLAYVATTTPSSTPVPTSTPQPTHTPEPTNTPQPSATPSPLPTDTPIPAPTRQRPTGQPPTTTPVPAVSTPLPLEWDMRVNLLNPPIKLLGADVSPGQQYWRLVRLEWRKAHEGGNTLLYASTINKNGQPVWGQEVIVEHGAKESIYTDPKPGEPHGANYPMYGTLNSYQVYVGGDLPSERVTGLGLGEWYGGLDHTSFILVFQRSTR